MGMNHKSIGDIINDNQGVQQLVEVCMSYMWDRVKIGEPELEYLVDEIGIDDVDVELFFNMLGCEGTIAGLHDGNTEEYEYEENDRDEEE